MRDYYAVKTLSDSYKLEKDNILKIGDFVYVCDSKKALEFDPISFDEVYRQVPALDHFIALIENNCLERSCHIEIIFSDV